MGIHYDYKSTRGAKPWRSKLKEKKLAERRAKRAAKEGFKQNKDENNMHDIAKPITLEDLTNPEKKMINKEKDLKLSIALKKIIKKRKLVQTKNINKNK